MRKERLGAVDDAPEVDVHHAFHVLELADLDVPGVRDAGVVVDLVDLAEMLFDLVGVEQEGLAFGDVEPVGLHLGADGLELFLGLRQTFGIDVADGEFGAERPSSMASACPIPEPAPVTTATFPAKPSMNTLPASRLRRPYLVPLVPGLSGSVRVQKTIDELRKFFWTLDLRHMPDSGEQLDLGVGERAACGLEVVRRENAVSIAPHDQSRSWMTRDRVEQVSSPLLPHTARGDHIYFAISNRKAPLPGRAAMASACSMRCPVTNAGSSKQRRSITPAQRSAVARGEPTQARHGEHAQQRGRFGAEPGAVYQGQAGDPVGRAAAAARQRRRPASCRSHGRAGAHPARPTSRRRHRPARWSVAGSGLRSEAEAGQIEADDAVFRREQHELRRPILKATADPVQQQYRRVGGVTLTPPASSCHRRLRTAGWSRGAPR